MPKKLKVQLNVDKNELKKRLGVKDGLDGKDGVSPDPVELAIRASKLAVDELLPKIPSQIALNEELPKQGANIKAGLRALDGEERLEIQDIDQLREELDAAKKTGEAVRVISSNRNLYQLLDVNVSGITTDQSIKWDGKQWVAYTPSTATPGGSDTQVQFNDGGSFGGDAGFTYNKTTNTATLTGDISAARGILANVTSGLVPFGSSSTTGLLDVNAGFYVEDGTKLHASKAIFNTGGAAIDILGGRIDFYTGGSSPLGSLRMDAVGEFGFGNNTYIGVLDFSAIATSDKNFAFPNTSGTVALTSDLPVGANPTASVGLTAVNGSASTFLRSDGAPALDQSITPTWTGDHTFANATPIVLTPTGSTNLTADLVSVVAGTNTPGSFTGAIFGLTQGNGGASVSGGTGSSSGGFANKGIVIQTGAGATGTGATGIAGAGGTITSAAGIIRVLSGAGGAGNVGTGGSGGTISNVVLAITSGAGGGATVSSSAVGGNGGAITQRLLSFLAGAGGTSAVAATGGNGGAMGNASGVFQIESGRGGNAGSGNNGGDGGALTHVAFKFKSGDGGNGGTTGKGGNGGIAGTFDFSGGNGASSPSYGGAGASGGAGGSMTARGGAASEGSSGATGGSLTLDGFGSTINGGTITLSGSTNTIVPAGGVSISIPIPIAPSTFAVLDIAQTFSYKQTIQLTTTQFQVGYNGSNYFTTTVDSTGGTTFDLVGTAPEFTFSDPVNVPDEAYGSGWNGNTEVPTKNAIYDKIETLLDGNGTATYVPFYSDANTLTSESVFNYNASSNFLGVNKATPLGHVHVGADTITTATPTNFSATASFGIAGYAFGSGNKDYSLYQRIGAIYSSALTGTYTELATSDGNFNSYTPAPNYSGSGYTATGVSISFEAFALFPDGTISPSGVTNSFTDNGVDPYSVTHTWSVNLGNPTGIVLIRDATDYLVVTNQSSPYEDTNTGWAALPHGLSTVSSYVVNVSMVVSSSPAPNKTTFRNTTTTKYTEDSTGASSATDNAAWTSGSPTVTPTSGPGYSGIFDGAVRIGGSTNSSFGIFTQANAPAPFQSTTDIITGLSNYGFFSSSATLAATKLSGQVPVANGGTGLSTFSGTGRIPFAGSAGTALTTDASFVILDGSVAGNRRLGLGTTAPAAIGHFVGTGYPPLRVGYDTSNYMNVAVTSAGAVTFDAVGASAAFTFSDAVTVNGLTTLAKGVRHAYVAKTGAYTLTSADYLVNWTSGTANATLPTAASVSGLTFILSNSGTGIITILTTSSQTISGVASGILTLVQWDTLMVMSDGANWIKIN